LLTKDGSLRERLGFSRVPHRRTVERRLNATLPEAEAQVAVLGQQVLEEVTPGPDEPQASAIDGRMYQAQGPLWHKRDREQERIPARLRNVDIESAWSKSGYRGWGQGYRLVLQGLVFPAPVPLFARWCPNSVGESTVLAEALVADQLPVTELLLGDSTLGGGGPRCPLCAAGRLAAHPPTGAVLPGLVATGLVCLSARNHRVALSAHYSSVRPQGLSHQRLGADGHLCHR